MGPRLTFVVIEEALRGARAPMLARVAPEESIEELVERSRAGDRAAYAALYGRLRAAVHGAVLSRAGHGDAADIVQEVFVTGWARLDDLREPAAFPGWILEIARRRAVDHKRRTGRRRSEELDEEVLDAGVEQAPRAEALQALDIVRSLPPAYRETLVMRLVEGLTGPEIAEATGLTPESVRVNLHRGMRLLRERLGELP